MKMQNRLKQTVEQRANCSPDKDSRSDSSDESASNFNIQEEEQENHSSADQRNSIQQWDIAKLCK